MSNTYDESDLDQIFEELSAEDDKLAAAKELHKKNTKQIKVRAKNLGVPTGALNGTIATIKKLRSAVDQMDKVRDKDREDFNDMLKTRIAKDKGLSGTPLGDVLERRADDKLDEQNARDDQEQREGAEALNSLSVVQ
ncbi:hypothetical protein [Maritalea porphyrae]|uniref:hypothetical protein n=1 Tax=Maritalea porphyrae TaxID=880732 RepID=UPI0022AFF664|nr:hypothetical protein [Maritalea porphyrae]MCZ4270760.1 hypothetical protein [Maritalea porphyrae]